MLNDLKQKATELYNQVIENVTIKNASKVITIIGVLVILWQALKMVIRETSKFVSNNWFMVLVFIFAAAIIEITFKNL